MSALTWLEDHYTGLYTVASPTSGGENAYGVGCLLPRLWAQSTGGIVQAALPALQLARTFSLEGAGTVDITLRTALRYSYRFRGHPAEPAEAATVDAAPHPFLQRVEVVGDVQLRLIAQTAEGPRTVPGVHLTAALHRSGARAGSFASVRQRGLSGWTPTWQEGGAADVFTLSGDHTREPIQSTQTPVQLTPGRYTLEIRLSHAEIRATQAGFTGEVYGELGGTEGISAALHLR